MVDFPLRYDIITRYAREAYRIIPRAKHEQENNIGGEKYAHIQPVSEKRQTDQ